MSRQPEEPERHRGAPQLKRLRVRGHVMAWSLTGVAVCTVGLLLLTGLAASPWLFLLYPLLIAGLLASLGVLALHLLRGL